MRNRKRLLAALLALGMTFSFAGCGSGDDSASPANKEEDESFEPTENIEVEEVSTVDTLPGGEESEILYLGENDINPTRSNPEKSTEMTLFEQKGGKVNFQSTSNADRFDNLAAAIASNKDIPDIFKYEWLSFPSQVVKGMYQPIDSIVDFNDDLWKSAKPTADQFVLGGEHFVAPLGNVASSMLIYNVDIIEAENLDDPYELYLEGEWNWDAWRDIMSQYVSQASGDDIRYGVNGFFRNHVVQQTGKNLVSYDSESNTFSSNLMDADIEKGQAFLYDLMKNGIILNGWYGNARDCFAENCLFYAMGEWAYTGKLGPQDGDNWAIGPMPQYTSNPQKITTSDMTAYMWVNGSKKADAVKVWFECNRIAKTDPQYAQTNKDKFMENNPYWTDEMYDVKMDVVSDDYLMIFDYAFGVSSTLGDRKQFDGNQCLVDYLYNGSSTQDDDGNQPTWSSVREQYSNVVESELETLNKNIEEYEADRK